MCQANALKQHFKLKIQTKHFWELKMTYSTHCQHKQKLKPKWARHYWRWCSQHHRGSKKSVVNSVVKKAGTVQHRAQNRNESKDNGKPQSHWVHFNPVLTTISAQEIKPLCLLLQEATSISPEQRQTFAEGTLCHCATETSPPTASALRSQQMFSLLPWKAPDALLTGWAFKNALNCFFYWRRMVHLFPSLPPFIHSTCHFHPSNKHCGQMPYSVSGLSSNFWEFFGLFLTKSPDHHRLSNLVGKNHCFILLHRTNQTVSRTDCRSSEKKHFMSLFSGV